MKIKIFVVVLIGLLMAVGLFFVGCGDSKRCPDDKDCVVELTGTVSGYYISGKDYRCSSADCRTNGIRFVTPGHSTIIHCGECGK